MSAAVDTLAQTVASLTDAVNALPARVATALNKPTATDEQLGALNAALVQLVDVINNIAAS